MYHTSDTRATTGMSVRAQVKNQSGAASTINISEEPAMQSSIRRARMMYQHGPMRLDISAETSWE
jgi:hypothetical protein